MTATINHWWTRLNFIWTDINKSFQTLLQDQYCKLAIGSTFLTLSQNNIHAHLVSLKESRNPQITDYIKLLLSYHKNHTNKCYYYEDLLYLERNMYLITGDTSEMSEKYVLMIHNVPDMGNSYFLPFAKFGKETSDESLLDSNPTSIRLVVFTGGADVNPKLYNKDPHSSTSYIESRDSHEVSIFKKAQKNLIPMVGICRGAQFLCVMAGGQLVQNVNGHYSSHRVLTIDGRKFQVTSSHHQMQVPPSSAKILAWADPPKSSIYEGSSITDIIQMSCEPEIVSYPSINAVGIQSHPEIADSKSEEWLYVQELLEDLIDCDTILC